MTAAWRNCTFFSYWLPPALWCAGILVLSGDWGSSTNTLGLMEWLLSWFPPLSPAQIQDINSYLRKVGHVLAYGTLYFLWFRAFRGHLIYSANRAFLLALGLCLLLSLLDEGHQSLLQNRSGHFQDVGLDLSAALLGAGITAAFWPRKAASALPAKRNK
jgi:VanZ family protein